MEVEVEVELFHPLLFPQVALLLHVVEVEVAADVIHLEVEVEVELEVARGEVARGCRRTST